MGDLLMVLSWASYAGPRSSFYRIENPEGGSVRKPVRITKRPASIHQPYHRKPVYLCVRRSFFASLSHRDVSSYASQNRPWRMLPNLGVLRSCKFHIRCAGSSFLQILHILSTSTYAALNFEASSPERVTRRHRFFFLFFFGCEISLDCIICTNFCAFYRKTKIYIGTGEIL